MTSTTADKPEVMVPVNSILKFFFYGWLFTGIFAIIVALMNADKIVHLLTMF